MQGVSLLLFADIVLFALRADFQYLGETLGVVFNPVLLHNSVALAAGYQRAYWTGLPTEDRQTLALETGIQNGRLGLVLIFNVFVGLGGMAVGDGWSDSPSTGGPARPPPFAPTILSRCVSSL